MEQHYVEGVASLAVGGDDDVWSDRWAASGAAGLSGRADGEPLAVPIALVRGVIDHAMAIGELSAMLGRPVDLDGLALLGERAAFTGFSRRGDVSCGGATRLLQSADGWIALSLARPDDIASMAAWLEVPSLPTDVPTDIDELWSEIETPVRRRLNAELIDRGTLLGLPVAAVGSVSAVTAAASASAQVGQVGWETARRRRPLEDLLVVDLSSLWAGPLVADLLGRAGCRIVKVESVNRPDGARLGSPDFYDLLHGGHESVALDFSSARDRLALRSLVERADVVIEASRPRAFAALGIDRSSIDGPTVWVSITGYGRLGPDADRVGFGDDAAAAAGLVTSDAQGLCFCGDAIADPLTGMAAARAVFDALARGGRWFVDVALSHVAATMASGPLVPIDPSMVAPPRARSVVAPAASLGQDTDQVLAEFGIRR